MADIEPRPPTRVYAAFAALSIAFLATIAWTIAREGRAEWRRAEARFRAIEQELRPDAPERSPRGLQQIWLPELGRVDRCVTCHRGIDDPAFRAIPQPFTAHPPRWLDSHPPDRFGCTVCHGGQGEATTSSDAAHRPVRHWPTPMRPAALLEAGCGTCHRERRPPGAPALAAGRAIVARGGCAGCHDIPGFRAEEVHAPRLDSVGYKLETGWLARYLAQPAVLPGARMPDFRLAHEEVQGLVAFLSTLRAVPPLEPAPIGWDRADTARGRELFARARCVTCHRVDERGGTVGPDLSFIGSRVSRAWLWSYLADPHREQPDTLMPRFRFAADELRDVTAYLATELVDPESPPPAGAPRGDTARIEEGRRVFIRRGCFGCHRLPGMESLAKIGPPLAGIGERPIEPADFLREPVAPTLPNWLYLKLRAPERMTVAASLMPSFAMDDETRARTVLALLSLAGRSLPASRVTSDPPAPAYEPQGAFGTVVSRYRCLSCHQVGGSGSELSTVALDRIGSQLQPAYLRSFMLDPTTVRVHLEVRMPRMHLTEAEAETVVDHATRVFIDDRLEEWPPPPADAATRGLRLYETLGCAACHTIGSQGGYVGPDLSDTGRRLKPGWVQAWLRTPDRWKAGTLQPDYGLSAADAQALAAYLVTLTKRTAVHEARPRGAPAELAGTLGSLRRSAAEAVPGR